MNKKAFYKLSYGVFIVSSRKGDRLNGQVANVASQVTAEPPQLAVALNKNNLTHEFVAESGVFSVSVLSQDTPMAFIGKFGFKSGRDVDKFADTEHFIGETRAPVVTENAVAWFECRVKASLDAGTHTVFVGEVLGADVLEGEPMTYAYYHKVKKGYSPPAAPTYDAEAKKEGEKPSQDSGMKKYQCTVCGYIYDPEKGDPDGNIPPGTRFEDIPEDWVCPVCGVSKDMFEPLDE